VKADLLIMLNNIGIQFELATVSCLSLWFALKLINSVQNKTDLIDLT
jgi:hypothetical protein